MRILSLVDIQNALTSAEREGADVDEPEGARYVRISETLLCEIAWNLGRFHGELIQLRQGITDQDIAETATPEPGR